MGDSLVPKNFFKGLKMACALSKTVLICGKGQNFNFEALKLKCLKISINDTFKLAGFKPDVIIWQDTVGEFVEGALYVMPETLRGSFNYPNKAEFYKRALKIEDDGLVAYPYTGLLGVHWAIKKGFKRIYITGFEFKNNHDYFTDYREGREWYTLKMYRKNYADLLKLARSKGIRVCRI